MNREITEIKSEKDWLDFVQNNLDTNIQEFNIKFDGWPKLEIIIEGNRFNGTLPTELMRGIVDFQDQFYRSYAELRYKSNNLQRLNSDDKEKLEFVFKIENNCTKGTAEEDDILNTILQHLDKIFIDMSGEEKLIGLAILVFSYTGYKIFEKISDNAIKSKELDAGTDALKIQRDAVVSVIETNNKAPKIAHDFKHNADNAFLSIFKNAQGAASISIGEKSWDSDAIQSLIQTPDKNIQKTELSMPLNIEGIRKNQGYLTLNMSTEEDKKFSMRVDNLMANPDEIAQLFDSFKSGRLISITFTAKIVDGEIANGNFIELTH